MAIRSHADFCVFLKKSRVTEFCGIFQLLALSRKTLPIRKFKIYGALNQSVFTISINVNLKAC
jgi:hypothetical protein